MLIHFKKIVKTFICFGVVLTLRVHSQPGPAGWPGPLWCRTGTVLMWTDAGFHGDAPAGTLLWAWCMLTGPWWDRTFQDQDHQSPVCLVTSDVEASSSWPSSSEHFTSFVDLLLPEPGSPRQKAKNHGSGWWIRPTSRGQGSLRTDLQGTLWKPPLCCYCRPRFPLWVVCCQGLTWAAESLSSPVNQLLRHRGRGSLFSRDPDWTVSEVKMLLMVSERKSGPRGSPRTEVPRLCLWASELLHLLRQ